MADTWLQRVPIFYSLFFPFPTLIYLNVNLVFISNLAHGVLTSLFIARSIPIIVNVLHRFGIPLPIWVQKIDGLR